MKDSDGIFNNRSGIWWFGFVFFLYFGIHVYLGWAKCDIEQWANCPGQARFEELNWWDSWKFDAVDD